MDRSRRSSALRRPAFGAALLALALGASCGNSKPVGVALTDGGAETGAMTHAACLDRPDELPRPPTAGLPCELIPPGLAL